MRGRLLSGFLLMLLGAAGVFWFRNLWPVNVILLFVGGMLIFDGLARRGIFHVHDLEAACKTTADMISRAQRSILLTSKSLDANAYTKWKHGEIKKLLTAQIEKGLEVEIICGEVVDRESQEMVKEWLAMKKNFRLYRVAGDPVPNGLLIDDDRELRLERPHQLKSPLRKNVRIKNPGAAVDWFLAQVDRYKARAELVQ